jgi:hypothetical protein
MRLTLIVVFSLLFFPEAFGQPKLILKKGVHRVRFRPTSRIGVVTKTDTFKYDRSLWKLDRISDTGITIRKIATYETKMFSYKELMKYNTDDWLMDSVIRTTNDIDKWSYIYQVPASYTLMPISYQQIVELQYAKDENESGCVMCAMFPLLVILSPIVSWEKGKFQFDQFLAMASIGISGTLIIRRDFKRREVKTYKIGTWNFKIKK